MDNRITDKDIEILCATNALASEQLRRIVAERQKSELEAELANMTRQAEIVELQTNNGVVNEAVLSEK